MAFISVTSQLSPSPEVRASSRHRPPSAPQAYLHWLSIMTARRPGLPGPPSARAGRRRPTRALVPIMASPITGLRQTGVMKMPPAERIIRGQSRAEVAAPRAEGVRRRRRPGAARGVHPSDGRRPGGGRRGVRAPVGGCRRPMRSCRAAGGARNDAGLWRGSGLLFVSPGRLYRSAKPPLAPLPGRIWVAVFAGASFVRHPFTGGRVVIFTWPSVGDADRHWRRSRLSSHPGAD